MQQPATGQKVTSAWPRVWQRLQHNHLFLYVLHDMLQDWMPWQSRSVQSGANLKVCRQHRTANSSLPQPQLGLVAVSGAERQQMPARNSAGWFCSQPGVFTAVVG